MNDDTKPIAIEVLDPHEIDTACRPTRVAWPSGDGVPVGLEESDAIDTVEVEIPIR